MLERALILSDSGRLTGDDFARILTFPAPRPAVAASVSRRACVVPYAQAEAEFERRTLECALAAANGQISDAAKMLRISRATFYKKLAKFGLAMSDSSIRLILPAVLLSRLDLSQVSESRHGGERRHVAGQSPKLPVFPAI